MLNMRLMLLLSIGLIIQLGKPTFGAEEDDQVRDLQELLRDVSTNLKIVRSRLASRDESVAKDDERTALIPHDCADIYRAGHKTSGVFRIWPTNLELTGSFEVFCDMEVDGGGWTIFQRRGDFGLPRDYFLKDWNEYKNGFGNVDSEFWLGNDRISVLTNQGDYELRVDLWDMANNTRFAKYQKFSLEPEEQRYRIRIAGYNGTAGDSMSNSKRTANGEYFSTKDKKNNGKTDCAALYKEAWWYSECHTANLNGLNLRGPHSSFAEGIEWGTWRGYEYSLAAAEMKIRPRDFQPTM